MKIFLVAIAITITTAVFAQTPQSFRYQATILEDNGQPLAGNQSSFLVSILRGQEKSRVYTEFHNITTDQFGVIDLRVGEGNAVTGQFNQIDWESGPHFIRVEIDRNGGSNYKRLAEVQLLSVPYALQAGSVDNTDDADADPQNEIQELSLNGNMLSISEGNEVELPENINNQTLSITGNEISISQGNTIMLPADSDNQTLQIDGNQLSISQGNAVELPENTDNQTLSIAGNEVSISQGNAITLPADEDNQILEINGSQLSISQGNSVELPADSDNQTLTISGNQLAISNGNSIQLPSANTQDPSQPVGILYQGSELFVHPTDNSTGIIFGSFANTGATSNFDGEANTTAIVANYGAGSYAASVCGDLEAFGFNDWYLPSRAELDAIYKQNYLVTGYEYERYWSSTEASNNMAYEIDFSEGSPNNVTKNQTRRVRCVRKN